MIEDRIAEYQVLRKLGQGAMGVVYLAHDASLDRDIALKVPNPDLLQNAFVRRRFLAEAKAAAALDHPFVCKIYGTGEISGTPYIAMEYVPGVTLKDKLAAGRLPVEETLRIAIEIVEALESAHRNGFVHRDLKPSNIMLSTTGHTKVMDFGLARRFSGATGDDAPTQTAMTEGGVAVGTLAYMSPEQLRAETLDARSDIFTMGIVLFEMLTGLHPFLRKSSIETATAILKDFPPTLENYLGGDAELWRPTLERMLVKDRDQRYSSIQEVRADLAGIQQALSHPSASTTAARPIPKRFRPRWRAAGVMLSAPVLAAVVFIVYHFFWATPGTALAFQARDWILVTDFDNRTGDPIFDKSLRTALIVGIQQSSYVNVFPDPRTQEALERMGKPKAAILDESLAAEVAMRAGIKGLLVCGIGKIGDVYSLTARLVDPSTRATAATQAVQAKGKDAVLPALDTLTHRIRERLGESLARIPGRVVPLPLATTSSLEALKAFVDCANETDARKAFGLIQHALELDPDFALAHIHIGQIYFIRGEGAQGEEHFKKALSLLHRLSLRERLWVQAVVEDWRGNREGAVDRYKVYLAQYPDDLWAWFRMGWAQMATLEQQEPAIEAFNRVLKLDPGSSAAYVNLATCYAGLKKFPQAIQAYEKAFQLRPEQMHDAGVNQEYGFVLVQVGNSAKARSTFESMLKLGDTEKARGHRSLALLDMYQGRYHSAVARLREAVLLNRTNGVTISELRDRLFLTGALKTMRQAHEMSAELDQIERMANANRLAPGWLETAGKLFHLSGKDQVASRLYNNLVARLHDPSVLSHLNRSARRDEASESHLKGIVALGRGQTAEAVEALEVSLRIRTENSTLDSLASAYAAMGKTDEAINRYRELSQRVELGHEGQEYWILAHYALGKLYEERKDIEQAKQHYRKLLEIWREADPDLPPAVEARARLQKL